MPRRLNLSSNLILSLKATGVGVRRYSSTSTTLPKPRLDYRAITENVVYKSHNAFNRKAPLPVGAIQSIERLYGQQKELSYILNAKRHSQSVIGDRIRQAGKDNKAKQVSLQQEVKELKSDISRLEHDLALVDDELLSLALAIPNDTHPLAPLGPESAAVVLSSHGPEPIPPSPHRDHVSICKDLDLLDLEAGATVTGSSWYYLLHEAALLEMALTNYGLSIALKHGFTPAITPDVIRSEVARRCGFQPRDNVNPPVSQMYHLLSDSPASSHPELVLSGTAEIPLAGMFANRILPVEDLPRKIVGLGRAFRAEAGARGAETRGLYRVHQFTKLELFAVSQASQSEELMEDIRRVQIEIFSGLGFPFRQFTSVLDMPTEELGASAHRKYDIEAWMPGRGSWGEISSLSNCTDYQARRLHIRHRPVPTPSHSPTPTGLPFAHTLNGTAIAVPRLIVTILENGAVFNDSGQAIGITLPVALKPFWPQTYSRKIVRFSEREVVQWV
ncbi:seryl-tRNA synthetase [Multifurca ochricompacta]|uniref:serine--tRNA ligase n=1 Tax=Multifurca ochricompacta TaxID=376703 RepID=A0AAD4QU40_9AGAM|nr:seryl-tRNA synthetase [Multifurca ochricompacta]